MNNIEERELIANAKDNPEAFGELYRKYVSRIYNYHYRHTSNHADAEDLTSRTFYRALRSIGQYRDTGGSFQAWLFRIAHNLVVNWYRDTSRRPEVKLDDPEIIGDEKSDPHRDIEKQEAHDALREIVETLPEERKTLIVLKFVEQMTNAEIGKVLGRTEGAIKALYFRTLDSLRTMLQEEKHHEEDNATI